MTLIHKIIKKKEKWERKMQHVLRKTKEKY